MSAKKTIETNPTLEDVKPDANEYYIGIFGGKPRYIKFDLNAFAEMERLYGTMEKADEALQSGSMSDIRKVLWLGLIWNEAILDEITGEPIRYKLTPYEVGSWLNTSNMKQVIGDLTKAINGSLPEGETLETPGQVAEMPKHAWAAAGDESDPNK